ncbi:hypothetical protein O181_104434 [Austropuccinia psidii MF-1]|uniref:Uncharacterized protein n=1 Tax=Austropuccinia psidii MF-1 TaxID=1389203 RepID=A0A9Q3JME5_9BASI|nr:hypothetical protein [Austropuccinia psidii MF-1]
MEGEDNQRKMAEPQRTDGGGAEGEYSVSSVSFKLITEEYASRRFNMSESVHFQQKEFMTSRPPLQLWGGKDLIILDPLIGSRPWAYLWSHSTPGYPAKLGPGGLQLPPWTADCSVRPTAHRPHITDRRTPKTRKWPKRAIYQS